MKSGFAALFLTAAACLFLSGCAEWRTHKAVTTYNDVQVDEAVMAHESLLAIGRAWSDNQVDLYDPYVLSFDIPPVPPSPEGIEFPGYKADRAIPVRDKSVTVYAMTGIRENEPEANAVQGPATLPPAPEDSAYFNDGEEPIVP